MWHGVPGYADQVVLEGHGSENFSVKWKGGSGEQSHAILEYLLLTLPCLNPSTLKNIWCFGSRENLTLATDKEYNV